MKRYASLILPLVILASCAQNTTIGFTSENSPETRFVLKVQKGQNIETVDTLTTDALGHFDCKVNVKKGQPQFYYIFRDETKVAPLLLEKGDKAVVTVNSDGSFDVSGSKGSEEMKEVNDRSAEFFAQMSQALSLPQNERLAAVGSLYVDYHKSGVKYLLSHPYSLSVIPVLYEKVSDDLPVFADMIDAVYFRRACDSLQTVYPESEYVKALASETALREKYLAVQKMVDEAPAVSYPDLTLPDTEGKISRLSEVDSKVVLLHFWSSEVAAQKMFNLDYLKPLYEKYHKRGLEIYAVDINPDKVAWAKVVKSQRLPWINVNDGLGTASPSMALYNVGNLPVTFIISGGELFIGNINSRETLISELERMLR